MGFGAAGGALKPGMGKYMSLAPVGAGAGVLPTYTPAPTEEMYGGAVYGCGVWKSGCDGVWTSGCCGVWNGFGRAAGGDVV